MCVCERACIIHQGTTPMMLLGGGVFLDACQIFSPTSPAGTSLSPWMVDAVLGTETFELAFGLSPI